MKKYLPYLLLGFVGCFELPNTETIYSLKYTPAEWLNKPVAVTAEVPSDPNVKILADSMAGVSKEDAETLYKIFSGLALYIEKTDRVPTTLHMITLMDKVKSDFGYKEGIYKNFSDAQDKIFIDKKYDDVKKIVKTAISDKEITNTQVASDLRIISEAAKVIINGK